MTYDNFIMETTLKDLQEPNILSESIFDEENDLFLESKADVNYLLGSAAGGLGAGAGIGLSVGYGTHVGVAAYILKHIDKYYKEYKKRPKDFIGMGVKNPNLSKEEFKQKIKRHLIASGAISAGGAALTAGSLYSYSKNIDKYYDNIMGKVKLNEDLDELILEGKIKDAYYKAEKKSEDKKREKYKKYLIKMKRLGRKPIPYEAWLEQRRNNVYTGVSLAADINSFF